MSLSRLVHAFTAYAKMYSKLSKARMKVWGRKARSIKSCVVNNKRSGGPDCLYVVPCLDVPEQLLNCQKCFKVAVALD